MISYKLVKGKYVFCNDGVYFFLTRDQISEMINVLDQIILTEKKSIKELRLYEYEIIKVKKDGEI